MEDTVTLPFEIWLMIIEHVRDIRDIYAYRQVCSNFYAIASSIQRLEPQNILLKCRILHHYPNLIRCASPIYLSNLSDLKLVAESNLLDYRLDLSSMRVPRGLRSTQGYLKLYRRLISELIAVSRLDKVKFEFRAPNIHLFYQWGHLELSNELSTHYKKTLHTLNRLNALSSLTLKIHYPDYTMDANVLNQNNIQTLNIHLGEKALYAYIIHGKYFSIIIHALVGIPQIQRLNVYFPIVTDKSRIRAFINHFLTQIRRKVDPKNLEKLFVFPTELTYLIH